MQWYDAIFEVIDMRSFSNLWFWIALAVLWSTSSHWVLGVPFDMITRARREGGQAQDDLETIVRINAGRMLYIVRTSGLWIAAIGAFVLTMLLMTGFWYGNEFAQAVFCLLFPMMFVGLLSLRAAARIEAGDGTGEALHRRLTWHRIIVQAIGMVSIMVTSLWGMWQNLQIGPM